jgi:hypothetical protein
MNAEWVGNGAERYKDLSILKSVPLFNGLRLIERGMNQFAVQVL